MWDHRGNQGLTMQESEEVLPHTVGKWEPTDSAAELLAAQGVPQAEGLPGPAVCWKIPLQGKPELSYMEMRKTSGS